MHDVVFVQNLESFQELFQNQEGFFFINGLLFSKHAFKGATVAIFVDKVKIILGFQHVIIRYYVFVFLYICQNVYLVHRAFF